MRNIQNSKVNSFHSFHDKVLVRADDEECKNEQNFKLVLDEIGQQIATGPLN